MGKDSLGVAVIGTAFMGRAHSNAWRNLSAVRPDLPGVRQQVLIGRDPASTTIAAQAYGWTESGTDWRAVLTRSDIDIVDICLPGHLHAEVAIAALAAGKHVIVEKPLANTLAEAEQMVAAAAAAPGLAAVGFNYRRVPALAYARQLIDAGEIGRVREVRSSYLQDWLADAAAPMSWRLRKESAGSGALGDLGSHVVDQIRFLTGLEVTDVSARTHTFVAQRPGPQGPEPVTVDDAAWATLGLTGGAVASVEVSRVASGRKNALSLEVYGERGAITFALESLNELQVAGTTGEFRRILVTEPDHPYLANFWPPGHLIGWSDTFLNQMGDFVSGIVSGDEVRPSFADGLAVQRVLAAIEESAATGHQISISEPVSGRV